MRLKDKVAIVTGAARGIGLGIAARFGREGAKVMICDLNENAVEAAEKELKAQGYNVLGVTADVTDRSDVDAMVTKTIEFFGTVDILVNNAGITRDAMLHKMTEEQWDQVMNVNLKGVFNCTQSVVNIMRDKNYGKIINIASTSAWGNIGQANYAATKAGIFGFTRTAALELAAKNINVNAVAPGGIMTDMLAQVPQDLLKQIIQKIPMKRWGTIEEVANVCLFLASDESSFITGQCLLVDGGLKMV